MGKGKKGKQQKEPKEEPVPDEDYDSAESEEEEVDQADEQDDDFDEDEEALIAGFEDNADIVPIENPKKRKKSEQGETGDSSVVYLGRIPHGFFEQQMKSFFSQFGTVKRLRLSRNKKTGRSKHYAFIEFESPEVAQVVAESMNNYLLFGHKLSCVVVPLEKVHPDTFKGANRKFTKIPYRKRAIQQHNKPKEPEQAQKNIDQLVKKENKKRQKLKDLGIEYEFGGYASRVPQGATHSKFTET